MSSSDVGLVDVARRSVLEGAWDHVRAKASAPGLDGVTVEAFGRDAARRLDSLSEALVAGTWEPGPARRVRLPHDPGRPIAVSTVEDRVVQRAVADVLGRHIELSDAAHGYRRGRSVATAVADVEAALPDHRWFVRTDVRKFFDRIDRARVGELLAGEGVAEELRKLVARLVRAGVLQGARVIDVGTGVPQGSALSPLLSNVYLRTVDETMEAAGFPYVRYADDVVVLAETEAQAADGLQLFARALGAIGLAINERKTRRGHVGDGFEFLGVRFDGAGRGLSRAAHRALVAGADRAGNPRELGALVAEWERWHGALRATDLTTLAVLAGAVVIAGEARLGGLAERRLELGGQVDGAVHRSLALRWLGAGTAGTEAALLVDAHRALAAGIEMPELGLGGEALGALRRGPGEAAEALAATGHTRWADAARGLAGVREKAALWVVEAGVGARWVERFAGREDAHLVEAAVRERHYRFERHDRPLTQERVAEHLAGRARRGVYLARGDGTVKCAAVEVGVRREAQLPVPGQRDGRGRQATLRALVEDHAWAWRAAGERCGVPMHVERGERRARLFLFFSEPVQMRHAFALLVRLEAEVGRAPEELVVVRTPGVQRVQKAPGPWVPLPLGRDPRTGRRTGWARDRARDVAEPIAAVVDAERIAVARVYSMVLRGPMAPDLAVGRSVLPDLPPTVREVLDGCAVVAALARKAARLGHLEGLERATLRETLGHLPRDDARDGLVQLLEPLGVGERAVERRLEKLTDHPMSCGGIRRRHPALCLESGCDCTFLGLVQGTYGTPVLHTLAVHQVTAFRSKARRPRRPRPVESEPAERPPKAEPPPLEPRRTPATRTSGRRSAPRANDDARPPGGDDFERALRRVVNLRRQVEDATRGLTRAEAQLERLFERHGADRIQTRSGILVRVPGPPPRFVLEV